MKQITKILSASLVILSLLANAQNPIMLKDVNATQNGGSYTDPSEGALLGSTYYFSGTASPAGQELWKTDGTAAGTMLVADLFPGGEDSYPYDFRVIGSTLFFVAY